MKLPTSSLDKDEYSRSPEAWVAGFSYRGERKPNGSMTTAGIGILQICKELGGRRLSKGMHRKLDRSIDRGLNWMRLNWKINRNPPNSGSNIHYYLYGLERVGDLMRRGKLAGHFWYREGAAWLLN